MYDAKQTLKDKSWVGWGSRKIVAFRCSTFKFTGGLGAVSFFPVEQWYRQVGMKSVGNAKICIIISYHNIFTRKRYARKWYRLRKIDTSKTKPSKRKYVDIDRYRSITASQIENIKTMNGHICNMFTTKWVTNSPTWILLDHMPIL
jgi:hypothetical protein